MPPVATLTNRDGREGSTIASNGRRKSRLAKRKSLYWDEIYSLLLSILLFRLSIWRVRKNIYIYIGERAFRCHDDNRVTGCKHTKNKNNRRGRECIKFRVRHRRGKIGNSIDPV